MYCVAMRMLHHPDVPAIDAYAMTLQQLVATHKWLLQEFPAAYSQADDVRKVIVSAGGP